MAWSFSAGKPVYLQISERIIKSVLSGEYKAGEQIPSIRQIALTAAVNPNTVQHAFAELETEGVIVLKGTLGRFVTEDTEVIENCKIKMARELVKSFAEDMKQLSLSSQQVLKMTEEAMK